MNIIISHNLDFNLKTIQAEVFRKRLRFYSSDYKLFDLMELGNIDPTKNFEENKIYEKHNDIKFISLKDLSLKYLDKDYTKEKSKDYNLEIYRKIFTNLYLKFREENNLDTN